MRGGCPSLDRVSDTPLPGPPVTIAITRRVREGEEVLMQAWYDAGTSLAQRFPGFLGSGWVRPSGGSRDWHMLYRFDSPNTLEQWQESRERARWLAVGREVVEDTRIERRTGIEGWFDEPHEHAVDDLTPAPAPPPRWKQAVVIFAAFFPVSLVLAYLLAPVSGSWSTPARVLLNSAVAIPLMTFLILPAITRAMQPFLTGSRRSSGPRR